MPSAVVTRFAPSPTGFLHIGGARTALFNWAYARANGGKMLLRIEDTDRERSSEEAIEAILSGLQWLGIDWDGEPIYQSRNLERHRDVVNTLLENGNAYRCYASLEELETMREEARAAGRSAVYNGLWRDRDPADATPGVSPAIRLKTPMTGETVIEDHVQGRVVFKNEDLDDLIILRSDGTPTYMLAVVADDHDMGVTHIIRGDDHLANAARQMLIYEALQWPVPGMAHIPLIHGADGKKLSKRHGALGVEAYRDMGYLPEALRNYLARLGWSHGDDEIFSTGQLHAWFGFDGMGKSAARFDFAKLENLNGHYLRTGDDNHLFEALIGYLNTQEAPPFSASTIKANKATLTALMPQLKERAKIIPDLLTSAQFLFAKRPLELTEKACGTLSEDAKATLSGLSETLKALGNWDKEAIEAALHAFIEERGLKFGKVGQPLRAALTGGTPSPGLADVLAALGKDESLARLGDQI